MTRFNQIFCRRVAWAFHSPVRYHPIRPCVLSPCNRIRSSRFSRASRNADTHQENISSQKSHAAASSLQFSASKPPVVSYIVCVSFILSIILSLIFLFSKSDDFFLFWLIVWKSLFLWLYCLHLFINFHCLWDIYPALCVPSKSQLGPYFSRAYTSLSHLHPNSQDDL